MRALCTCTHQVQPGSLRPLTVLALWAALRHADWGNAMHAVRTQCARSAHAVQSFGCRPILEPLFQYLYFLRQHQQEYNDVHGFYRARVEHLFARLWQWRIVRNVWTRSATELHGHVRILLHLTQFCIRRQTRYQPYGPWPHVPESVWAQEEATVVEEENDDGVCCQLCGHRPGDISECGTCHLNMCASCMPLHSCTL